MSDLIVIGYDNFYQADETRLQLIKRQEDHLIDLEDAVVATKTLDGEVKLSQVVSMPQLGAVSGGLWGALIGMIFLSPWLGVAIGASAGAVSGALTDVGINDNFMKRVADDFKPGTSALFILVLRSTPDKVIEAAKGLGGRIIQTTLNHEDEGKLQAVLDQARSA